jgi:hypothetical protein
MVKFDGTIDAYQNIINHARTGTNLKS